MKQTYFIIIFFLSSFSLMAQTVNINQGCAPLETSFTPPTGFTTFFWDFGDNSTSDLANPEHIFINPGTFQVDFRANAGGEVIGSVTITVFEQPDLQIEADMTSGCFPLAVTFENNSIVPAGIDISSYQWVFGDGTSPSNAEMPTHTYTQAGNFTVSLALDSNVPNCAVTEIFEDFIETSDTPVVSFTTSPNPPTACEAPLNVAFNNTSMSMDGIDFNWDFGNGNTSTTVQAPDQTYSEEGQFTITLTGTNQFGCSNTQETNVSVGPPLSEFVISDTVCLNQTTFTQNNAPSGSFLWNFGPQAIPSTSTAQEPLVRFLQEGLVTVSLTVSTGTCSSTSEKEIFVQDLDPSFSISPDAFCNRPTDVAFTPTTTTGVVYEWRDKNENIFSEEQNPTFTFTELNNNPYFIREDTLVNQVSLTIISEAGCRFRTEESIKIFEPTAVFKTDKVDGCAPLTINFRDTSVIQNEIVNWEWHFGNGDVMNTDEITTSYTYENAGDYEAFLVITNEFGCTDTSYLLPILVGEPIMPDFEVVASEVCPGDTVRLNPVFNHPNIDEWHFETDNGRSFHCYNDEAVELTFVTETGPMELTLTVGYNGCFSDVLYEDFVTVKGPIAQLDYSMDCETPHQFAFVDSSYEASNVTWYFGDSTQSNELNPIHEYDTTGAYMVYLEVENPNSGCPISIDSTIVYVKDITANFVLDSLLCKDQEYQLNAQPSQDVDADCWRGYTWFFSNNRPITTQSPSIPYTFTTKGEQELWLETTDINGCKDSSYLQVDVFEINADLEKDLDRICFPMEVNFQDLSTADTTINFWAWNFGDMQGDNNTNTSHLYTAPPTIGDDAFIEVSLSVQDVLGCSSTHLDTIYYYQPESQVSINMPANICEGDSLVFTATDFTQEGSNLEFNWSFGNGETANTQMVSHTFNEHGVEEVILNFEEIATGCPGSTSVFVSVQSYPEAAFSSNFDDLDVICHPQNAVFQDESTTDYPLDYSWNFGNGQTAFIANPSTAYGKGTFEVELIAFTANGCADTTYQSYTLVGPEGDFNLSADEICLGAPITVSLQDTVDISSFTWDFRDGTSLENTDPASHVFNNAGQQDVLLILRSGECTLESIKSFNIFQPLADFETENMLTEICIGNSLSFNNNSSSANTWIWNFDDGMTSIEENPTHIFNTEGIVSVSLEAIYNPLGCRDTLVQEFSILSAPNTVVQGDTICVNSIAALSVLNPNPNSQYEWLPANLFLEDANRATTVQTIPLNETSTFILNETTESGCMGSNNISVSVIPTLTGEDVTLETCENTPIVLSVPENEFYTYNWSPSDRLSCNNCASPEFNGSESQSITAQPMDNFGLGCADTIAFTFDINVINQDIAIPNVFTPNGDEVNEHFNIVTEAAIADLTIHAFRVYNRFGQLVYDNDTPETGWDGTYKGKLAPSDVYVYYIEISYLDCIHEEKSGDVTLVR